MPSTYLLAYVLLRPDLPTLPYQHCLAARPSLTALLQVQYTALPHYEDKFEDFKADTVVLRRRFTPEGEPFVGVGQGGEGFSFGLAWQRYVRASWGVSC